MARPRTLLTQLAAHRVAAQLTYVQLAELVGLSESRLHGILSHPRPARLSARTQYRIEQYLATATTSVEAK